LLSSCDEFDALVGVDEEISWLTVVGSNSTILKSADSGRTWCQVRVDSVVGNASVTFNDVSMLSAREIFVVGDTMTILHSTDSGRTFDPLAVELIGNRSEANLLSTDYVRDSLAYAVGTDGVILKCDLEGDPASCQLAAEKVRVTLNSVLFVGSQVGFAVGEPGTCGADSVNFGECYTLEHLDSLNRTSVALRTQDGSQNWQLTDQLSGLQTLTSTAVNFSAVSFSVAVAGLNSTFYQVSAVDTQWKWQQRPIPFHMDILALHQVGHNVVAAGVNGTLAYLLPSGEWVSKCNGDCAFGTLDLKGAFFPSETSGVVVGDNKIYRTSDGNVWTEVLTLDPSISLHGLAGRRVGDYAAAGTHSPSLLLLVLLAVTSLAWSL